MLDSDLGLATVVALRLWVLVLTKEVRTWLVEEVDVARLV